MQKHTKLGQLLVAKGMVQEWQFLTAMGARRPGQKLGEIMVERSFLSEEQLFQALSLQMNLPFVTLGGRAADPASIKAMPGHIARRFIVFPVAIEPAKDDFELPTLTIAMTDPSDVRVVEALRFLLEVEVKPVLATRKDILKAIDRTYPDDDPGSADILPIPFPRSRTGRSIAMSAYAA